MYKDKVVKVCIRGIPGRLKKLLKERCEGVVLRMAEETGIKRVTLNTYLRGRAPSLEALIRISLTYNVSLEWLVTGENAKQADLKAAQNKARELISKLETFLQL